MGIDIKKYLTNKEVEINNEDFNMEKLEKDIRKGYVLSEEVEAAKNEVNKENTARYVELEDKYNKLEKSYSDIEARNTELTNTERNLKLEVEMVSQGFKKENLQEISALRNSLFKEEEDDAKAISLIKEKYKATYFPEVEKKPEIPDENSFKTDASEPKQELKVSRLTSIKDLKLK